LEEKNAINIRLTLEGEEKAKFEKLMLKRGFTIPTELTRVLIAEAERQAEVA
jgi:hypothetical protein